MSSLFPAFGNGDPSKALKAGNGPTVEQTILQARGAGYGATRMALGAGSELTDASLERAKAAGALLSGKGRR